MGYTCGSHEGSCAAVGLLEPYASGVELFAKWGAAVNHSIMALVAVQQMSASCFHTFAVQFHVCCRYVTAGVLLLDD